MHSSSYNLWSEKETPPSAYDGHFSQISVIADNEKDNPEVTSQASVDERGQWGNKAEFLLSCIGLSVGLGNVWRFPYLAYKHGGAAFLIAYLILQFLVGKPMYFMELVMGQYSAKGPTGVWRMNPSAKGIGISMALISLVVAIYYNVIMAYTLFYFFSSMQTTLPWTVCKEEWAQFDCVEQFTKAPSMCIGNYTTDMLTNCTCTGNATFDDLLEVNCTEKKNLNTASELFFAREVIEKADVLDYADMGAPLWRLSLCLLLSWMVVIACLIKGVKSSGKVVYFTATFPYVILLILLVRGATLDGAIDGVLYFVVPKWEKLLDIQVWVAAAGQMFFSLSVSFGGIIMFGSYNNFKNKVYGDAMLIAVMDVITSIVAGLVIFTTFGGMAKKLGVNVEDVAKGGYGLAFIAYPEALSQLPIPQLWSVLFFFMLFTLGLDSEFALLETVLTCIQDEFPKLRKYKSPMCVILGIVCFFLALPCVTPAGDYVVTIMDHYGADFSVLFVAMCECISVMWVYGVRRFMNDVKYMLGRPPSPSVYWIFCWAGSSPILIGALFVYRMVQYNPPLYADESQFPMFAQGIGWCICAVVMCPIPATFLWMFARAKGGVMNRLRTIITPTADWGPADGGCLAQPVTASGQYTMTTRKHGIDNPVVN